MASYVYDAWGKVLSSSGTLANVNPLRYRGYYYDTETRLYYLQSRYYDPVVKRFINADGYVCNGPVFSGQNMFSYCGNNPIYRVDHTGESWSDFWVYFAANCSEYERALAVAGGLSQVDSPAIGPADALALVSLAAFYIYAAYDAYEKTKSHNSISAAADKVTTDNHSKKKNYFPANPYSFNPKGLVMSEYPGTKNGKIIEWRDPISNSRIFEWDEDLRHGAHYHAMLIEWDGNHMKTHYLPGSPVPEPWNTIYFGG